MRFNAPVLINIKNESAANYKFDLADPIYRKAMAKTLENLAKHTDYDYAFGHTVDDKIILIINAHQNEELSRTEIQIFCSKLASAATSFFNTNFDVQFRTWSNDLPFPTDTDWDEITVDSYGAYLSATLARKEFSVTVENIANSTLNDIISNLPSGVAWTLKNGIVWEVD